MLSGAAIFFIALVGLFSAFVSGVFGMAGGQIFLAVLLVLMPVAPAMVVFTATQAASGAWRGWLWRHFVHRRVAWQYIVGSLLAYAAMLHVSFVPSKPMVYLGIGLMPFAAFLLPKRFAPDITRPGAAFVCGAFVMVLQLLIGQAGNVLDVFFQASPLDRKTIVATKAVTQLVSQVLRILYFGALAPEIMGEIPWWGWVSFLATAIAGTSMAPYVLHRMTDDGFRVWTKRIISSFSALYVARGLWLLAQGQ